MNQSASHVATRTKLETTRKKVRGSIRFVVAALFWLHAIGITHLARVRLVDHLPDPSQISEVILLTVILFYSYLASNGWWSLLFDVGYVYLFPLWITAKYGWKLTKLTAGSAGRELAQSIITVPTPSPAAEPKVQNKSSSQKQSRDSIARPFQQFALLWCGVILASHNPLLTAVGLLVVTMAAGKAIYGVNRFLNGPMEWLTKAQAGTEDLLNKTVEKAMSHDPSSSEFKTSVVSIRIYEAILRWLCNRTGIENWVQGMTLLILVPCYAYISILSGFAYLAIAHLFAISWSAKEALVDALFMPLAWTDLPHSLIIRTLAGLQVGVLAFLSYQAIFQRISQKADQITKAAEALSRKLANPVLQSRIIILPPPSKPPLREEAAGDVAQRRLN